MRPPGAAGSAPRALLFLSWMGWHLGTGSSRSLRLGNVQLLRSYGSLASEESGDCPTGKFMLDPTEGAEGAIVINCMACAKGKYQVSG